MFGGFQREADGADAGIEVEDIRIFDVFRDFFQSHFVNGEVNLEKAVRGVRVGAPQDFVLEEIKDRVGLFVLEEAAFDDSLLVRAEEERLVFVSRFVVFI